MVYAYLFEAKSIQQYLFSSGKLKDVISASERLDRLIDTRDDSVLAKVLLAANLKSDLLHEEPDPEAIHFLRCKGGAFYAACRYKHPLEQLRSLWTLTVGQLFPSMVFTDALAEGTTLQQAVDKGHTSLAADRNAPRVSLPFAPAFSERYPRTGAVAVPQSELALKATHSQEHIDHIDPDKGAALDIDTEKHRQAYQAFGLRDKAALQHRFTPEHLNVSYPIDFEKEFEFKAPKRGLSKHQAEAIKDMALVHIDGNGLGILLMKLKEALKDKSDQEYQQGFRCFSEALNVATVSAAREATDWLYKQVIGEGTNVEGKGELMLPMRPIVLGGDDITLFCRADLALGYSRIFCRAFKKCSGEELGKMKHKIKGIEYLTASGGILYHKASHPFLQSHHLVEALCEKAKVLTKSVYGVGNTDKVGPAALAFYRVSNATQQGLEQLLENAHTYPLIDQRSISMGVGAYFVDADPEVQSSQLSHRVLVGIDNVLDKAGVGSGENFSLSRFRQMATELANGDWNEAQRIFKRGNSLMPAKDRAAFEDAIGALNPSGHKEWYWEKGQGQNLQTFINDLLVVAHYQPVRVALTTMEDGR